MSIRKAARIVGLTHTIADRRVKQWNDSFGNQDNDDFFPGAFKNSGREPMLTDEHTIFIFEKIDEMPVRSAQDIADLLCKVFEGLSITGRAVHEHMVRKCRPTYKRVTPRYRRRNDETTIQQRYDAVTFWRKENIK